MARVGIASTPGVAEELEGRASGTRRMLNAISALQKSNAKTALRLKTALLKLINICFKHPPRCLFWHRVIPTELLYLKNTLALIICLLTPKTLYDTL